MDTSPGNSSDRTAVDIALFVVRIAAGIIFMGHGAQKLFGWFDGPGLEATIAQLGSPLGYLVAVVEFFGGIGLVFGFPSRFSAAALIVIMMGAIVTVHGPKGFFMQNGGFQYNISLIANLLPTFLRGPGRLSIGQFFLAKSCAAARPLIGLE